MDIIIFDATIKSNELDKVIIIFLFNFTKKI